MQNNRCRDFPASDGMPIGNPHGIFPRLTPYKRLSPHTAFHHGSHAVTATYPSGVFPRHHRYCDCAFTCLCRFRMCPSYFRLRIIGLTRPRRDRLTTFPIRYLKSSAFRPRQHLFPLKCSCKALWPFITATLLGHTENGGYSAVRPRFAYWPWADTDLRLVPTSTGF